MAADKSFDEETGIDSGLCGAIKDYIDNFNLMGYQEPDGTPVILSRVDIKLENKNSWEIVNI